MTTVILKPDREKKLRNLYPWVYADEIANVEGEPEAGELVEVKDARGEWVGRAFFDSRSHIPARMLTLDAREKINRAFFETRIRAAAARREGGILNTDALRLVHAEADGLPGLIVDRLGEIMVVQIRNAGMESRRDEIVRALKQSFKPIGIMERSDTQARIEEGLEPRVGVASGEVPEQIIIHEDDVEYLVNVRGGQKTGFYLDQRDNRRLLGSMVRLSSVADHRHATDGARVLDVYSYTGGFSLHATRAGATCLAVDKDGDALQLLEANARRNGAAEKIGARWGDAEEVMTHLATEGRRFTHIVLDPPTLAKHRNDVPRVKQLFTRLVAGALAVLEANGVLMLSTCAYHIAVNDLIESARLACSDAGRRAEVLTVTYQPADHPWILQIPETLYLKTLILRVV